MRSPDTVAVHVAQISSEQVWTERAALTRNADKVLAWYDAAATEADLVVFPELTLSGYIPLKGYDQTRKRLLADAALEATEHELPRLAARTAGRRAAMVVGFMESSAMRNEMHNSLALLQDGAIAAVYRKVHLPVEENHYFVPGDDIVVVDCVAGRVALSICYDMVFPETARMAALRGAELLVVSSNWLGIANLRRLGQVLPIARALEEQMHVVFVNGVGDLEVRGRTWRLYGSSTIVNAAGTTLATAGEGEEWLTATLERGALAEASDVFPVLRDRRPSVYADLTAPLPSFSTFATRR